MANAAFTLSEALETAKQHQHGDLDPAVVEFLGEKFHEIWQRVKAQPPAYIPTREEFAVLNNFSDIIDDNEITQEDIPRLWEHHPAKAMLAIIQEQGESKKYHEMTQTSKDSLKSYPEFPGMSPYGVTSLLKDGVQLWQNPCEGALPRPHQDRSLIKGSTAAYETGVTPGCEPCRQRKINCNALRPICQHCKDCILSCVYTDGKRHRAKK